MSGSGPASRRTGLSTVTRKSSANAPRSSASQRPARDESREGTGINDYDGPIPLAPRPSPIDWRQQFHRLDDRSIPKLFADIARRVIAMYRLIVSSAAIQADALGYG